MTAVLARLILALAGACLGQSRREWAVAMQGELEAAIDDGKPLAFATGCLMAACREMPRHEEGRFVLANHGVVLGVLLPIAALQLLCAAGSAFPQGSIPILGNASAYFMAHIYMAAVPLLLSIWLLLCVLHLRLAWVLLEGDWPGVIRIGSLIAGGAVTLMVFTGVLLVKDGRTVLHASMMAVEFMAIAGLARWHTRLFSGVGIEQPA